MYKNLLPFLLALPLIVAGHPGKSCCKPLAPAVVEVANSTAQRTFAMLKPDSVAKKAIGEIIALIEKNGFKIVHMKTHSFSPKEAEIFYAEHKGKQFFADLVSYITSGPVVVLVLEKENAVSDWRDLIGTTDPAQARPGTIRKMYAENKSKNAVHGSDSLASAEREIKLFFN